jgi:phage protein D
MALSRPRAKVTLDGTSLSSAEAALARATVSLSAAGSHDRVELWLWSSTKLSSAGAGSTLSLALGEDGSESDVFSGEVTEVRASADGLYLEALASTIKLSRARKSQTYLSQSVADIVRDLASDVGIDEVQGDTQLDAYSVDDRRNVWMHLLDLARLVGADVSASAAGELRFVPPRTGSADAKLRYGADLLWWSVGGAPQPDAPDVAAQGAGSESGADKWHWIKREPSFVNGQGAPLLVVPALRTRDAAETMAQALSDRAARAATQGSVAVRGNPDLRPGDLVELSDLPSGDPGTLRVLDVVHVLDGRRGFATSLRVEGAGS